MLKNRIILIIILLFMTLFKSNFAQTRTTQWRLIWDPNSEEDMAYYKIFRGTDSEPTTQIGTVTHPNAIYVDNNLLTGTQYYYRIKAVDQTELESDFSETVSAAIPRVSDIPNQSINQGSIFATIQLDNYVLDPDQADNQLSWTISGNNQLAININASRVVTISVPSSSWYGTETITFRASDPDGFFDQDNAVFTVNATPSVTDILDQLINQGQTFATLNLDNFVSDPDHDDDEMSWSYSGNNQLVIAINSNRIATISVPSPTWSGNETITFRATDPQGAYHDNSAVFKVNGAPQITRSTIPDQKINQGELFQPFDLDDFVSDPDNSKSELQWIFSGAESLAVNINGDHGVTITPKTSTWFGSESITFTVSDPGGLQDNTTANYTVLGMNSPVVQNIPNQYINHGHTFNAILLDNFVSDPESMDSELLWSFSGNQNLTIEITESRQALVYPQSTDWVGTETITFTVTDPQGHSDHDQVIFTINGAPIIKTIPDQTIIQGESFTPIQLDQYIDDPNDILADLTWQITGNQNLQVSENNNRVVNISSPDVQWIGSEQLKFKVTDFGGLSDSTLSTFTVNGVYAPQVTKIPNQVVGEGLNFTIFDLDDYVNDADSPDNVLQWSYSGNRYLLVNIDGDRNVTLTKPSQSWVGSDTILFRVSDPQGNSANDQCLFISNAIPQISNIPDQSISAGQTFSSLHLDDYVSDRNDPDENLIWEISGNSELSVSINGQRNVTVNAPNAQWSGSELLTFTVTDPFGESTSDIALFARLSDTESTVAILGLAGQTINQGEEFDPIDLDEVVNCNEQLKPLLKWSCSESINLIVDIDTERRLAYLSAKNQEWYGSEELVFKLTTPAGYQFEIRAVFTIKQNVFSTFDFKFLGSGTIIEFNWQTVIPLRSKLMYGQDKSNLDSESSTDYSLSHSYTISGLKPKTIYQFQATGIDSNGNDYYSRMMEIETGLEGEINVFPNPYRAGEFPENDVINFANLPQGSSVLIYNFLGEPIFNKTELHYLFRWDVRNDYKKEVQSGLYIYVVKGADNKKLTSGKLVIIR